MKTIVIVLVCAVVFAVLGFVVTAAVVQHNQNAGYVAPAPTGDPQRDLANSMRSMGQGADDMAKTQSDAMIGAGVGLGCGVLIGVGISMFIGKKKAAPVTA